jgi:hypothetical protein
MYVIEYFVIIFAACLSPLRLFAHHHRKTWIFVCEWHIYASVYLCQAQAADRDRWKVYQYFIPLQSQPKKCSP